jgi:hypothetical protein
LVAITVTASWISGTTDLLVPVSPIGHSAINHSAIDHSAGLEIGGPERVRQQNAQWLGPVAVIDQHRVPAVFEQHLSTAPTGHQDLAPAVGATERHEAPTTGNVEVSGQRALGAEP